MKDNRPMKICMLDTYLTTGGVATFLKLLCSKLVEKGHTVYLVTASDQENRELIEEFISIGVQVSSFPKQDNKFLTFWKILKKAHRLAGHHKVDVFHSHHRIATFAGIVLRKVTSATHLLTFHVIKDDHRFLLKLWNREHISVPSKASKQHLVRHYQINSDRIKVIRNAITPEVTLDEQKKAILREKYFKDTDKFYVGYIGRISHVKGVDVLLESIPVVKRNNPEIEFRIFGEGNMLSELKQQCRAGGLDPEQIFMGKTNAVNELLALIDMCVIPSRSESFCLLALECMRAGKPVVASEVGGIPEVLSHNETALLIEAGKPEKLADSILKLYSDRGLAKKLAENGKRRFNEKFSAGLFSEKYLDYYHRIVREKGDAS